MPADGSGDSFWQSPPADQVAGPVSVSFSFAEDARVSSLVIDWNEPASDFTVQTSEDGGQWSTFAEITGNTLAQSIVHGSSVVARKVRVMMTAPVSGPGGAYSAKSIRIMSAPLKMGVQDCAEASTHGDARDVFFFDPAPEFDPLASTPMRGTAALLENAIRQLGEYTAELTALKPKIEACKKGASFLARSSDRDSQAAFLASNAGLLAPGGFLKDTLFVLQPLRHPPQTSVNVFEKENVGQYEQIAKAEDLSSKAAFYGGELKQMIKELKGATSFLENTGFSSASSVSSETKPGAGGGGMITERKTQAPIVYLKLHKTALP